MLNFFLNICLSKFWISRLYKSLIIDRKVLDTSEISMSISYISKDTYTCIFE